MRAITGVSSCCVGCANHETCPPACVKTLSYELPFLSPTLAKRHTQFFHSWMPLYLEKRGFAIGASSWITAAFRAPVPSEMGRPRYFAVTASTRAASVFIDPFAGGAGGFGGPLGANFSRATAEPPEREDALLRAFRRAARAPASPRSSSTSNEV